MLAGVGPVPAALLVVAADDGWSAQTAEHVAVLDALGVRHALLAVTKADLADPAPVLADVRDRLATTSMGAVPAVAVSALTGRACRSWPRRWRSCSPGCRPPTRPRPSGCGSTGPSRSAAPAPSSPARWPEARSPPATGCCSASGSWPSGRAVPRGRRWSAPSRPRAWRSTSAGGRRGADPRRRTADPRRLPVHRPGGRGAGRRPDAARPRRTGRARRLGDGRRAGPPPRRRGPGCGSPPRCRCASGPAAAPRSGRAAGAGRRRPGRRPARTARRGRPGSGRPTSWPIPTPRGPTWPAAAWCGPTTSRPWAGRCPRAPTASARGCSPPDWSRSSPRPCSPWSRTTGGSSAGARPAGRRGPRRPGPARRRAGPAVVRPPLVAAGGARRRGGGGAARAVQRAVDGVRAGLAPDPFAAPEAASPLPGSVRASWRPRCAAVSWSGSPTGSSWRRGSSSTPRAAGHDPAAVHAQPGAAGVGDQPPGRRPADGVARLPPGSPGGSGLTTRVLR